MRESIELRLSGTGGQGLILAGVILAEAAIRDGKNAVQTQSYGPEARGGASKAEVIIGQDEIDYPKVTSPDIVLAMSQEACYKYAPSLRPGGVLIIDATIVTDVPKVDGTVHAIPITHLAREQVGRVMTANVVALGALVGLSGLVSVRALKEAVLARIPAGTETPNMKALEVGLGVVGKQLHRVVA